VTRPRPCRHWAVLAAIVLVRAADVCVAEGPRLLAVCVGIDEYTQPTISPLRAGVRDARAVAQAVSQVAGAAEDDVVLLTSDAAQDTRLPTRSNILQALRWAQKTAKPPDVFLLYFAGHGVSPAGKSYILPMDAVPSDDIMLVQTALPVDTLRELLSGIRCAHQVVVLDCCRNDPSAGRGEGASSASPELIRDVAMLGRAGAETAGAKTSSVLFSCSEGERSYERADGVNGVFTYCLVEGLRGAAARGGQVTLADLAAHVETSVPAYLAKEPAYQGADVKQTPWHKTEGTGQLVLARTPEPEGPRLPVTLKGKSYATIKEALAQAQPGDTVRVGRGTFTGNLELRGVSLVGDGPDSTRIVCDGEGPAIHAIEGRGDIVGVKVSAQVPAATVLRVSGGEWKVRGCVVSGGSVGLDIPGGQTTVEDCEVSMVSGSGCRITGAAKATLTGTQLHHMTGPDGVGIHCGGNASLVLADCEVSDNEQAGLVVEETATAKTRRNQICGNAGTGLIAASSAVVSCEGDCLSGNTTGVWVHGNGQLDAKALVVKGSINTGVTAEDESKLSLNAGSVQDSGAHGLCVRGSARVVIEGLTVASSGRSAVSGCEEADVRATDCRLVSSQSTGVSVSATCSFETEGCTISESEGVGLAAKGQARLTIKQTAINSNGQTGITLKHEASADLFGGEIASNGGAGLVAYHNASTTLTRTRVLQNGSSAVAACHESRVTLDNVEIRANKGNGVYCSGNTIVTLSGSRCSGNSSPGVYAGHGAKLVAKNNELWDNKGAIQGEHEVTVDLNGNYCHDNSYSGISITDTVEGTMTGNRCHRNNRYGIQLGPFVKVKLEDNKCEDNAWGAIIDARTD